VDNIQIYQLSSLEVFFCQVLLYSFITVLYVGEVVFSHTVLEEFYCKDSDVEYGKSLKGGNAAGLFDNYGKTKNIQVRNSLVVYVLL